MSDNIFEPEVSTAVLTPESAFLKESKPSLPNQPNTSPLAPSLLEQLSHQAHLYPRKINSVQNNALAELTFNPAVAPRMIYSIPYNEGKSNQTMVTGLSTRAAECLARCWGNCSVDTRIERLDMESGVVRGYFYDHETNFLSSRELRLSLYYKPREGGRRPFGEDMKRNAIQSALSKVWRNVCLNGIPLWLKDSFFEKAKELIALPQKTVGKIADTIETRISKGRATFIKEFRLKESEFDNWAHGQSVEDEASFLALLQGTYNAIREGEVSVDDVFRPGKNQPVTMPEAKE